MRGRPQPRSTQWQWVASWGWQAGWWQLLHPHVALLAGIGRALEPHQMPQNRAKGKRSEDLMSKSEHLEQ